MKAIVQDRYGSADVLRLEDVPRPEVEDDDVLLRVFAAGVDRGVWHMMAGLPLMIRVFGFGFRGPKIRTPGNDVAGRVEAVGKKVTDFRVGDAVFGSARGTFAEYTCAKEKNLAPKPSNLSFAQAAAVPVSALTALQGLRDHGKLEPQQKVLVVGASGGVGTFAVQIAKALGAEVTGVCSTSKVDLVRSLGAEDVIDYQREDIAEGSRRYDLVLDIGGNRSLSKLRSVLSDHGTLVIVGGEEGGKWLGGADRSARALLLSPWVRHNLRAFVATSKGDDLLYLKELIEDGKIAPIVDREYSLSEAPDAIRHMQEGRPRGKTVITVSRQPVPLPAEGSEDHLR
jgi:NADPH:quinone reductase-like Zn-dependent oxidoreductase